MRFVVDEWLFHDLDGENGTEVQLRAALFLENLVSKHDQLVVLWDSPWMKKAHSFMGRTDPLRRGLSRQLWTNILLAAERCEILREEELKPLPQQLQRMIDEGQVDKADYYLLQLCCSTDVSFLVTTDGRLQRALAGTTEVKIELKDDFLDSYIGT
jgi:hypothetical protein